MDMNDRPSRTEQKRKNRCGPIALKLQRCDLATISGSVLSSVVETYGKATAVPPGMKNLEGDSIWGSLVITGARLF